MANQGVAVPTAAPNQAANVKLWNDTVKRNNEKRWNDTVAWNSAAAAHTQFGAPTAHPTPLGLPAGAEANFGQQRSTANEMYGSQVANNDYQRSGAQQSYIAQFRNLADQYNHQREDVPYAANAHGMLNSGVFHQQLQDYAQQRLRATGDLHAAQAQQLGGFDLVRKNIEAQRAQALASIEAQRQAMMGQIAPGTIQ